MRDKHGIGQAIVMITQLSINMLVPVFMCLFIGIWLDKRLGTGWLTLVFLILGIMSSIRSMFITLKPLLKGEREKKDEAFVFDEAGCDSESSDSQVYLYQNFWQRKVKLWAMKSTLWYMDMFL